MRGGRLAYLWVGVDKLCFYFGPLCFMFMLEILTYRIAGKFRGVPKFVIFVVQFESRN